MVTLPETARAYQLTRDDDVTAADLVELPVSDLGQGDLLVRVTHSSVNYKDGLALTGTAPIARRYPLVPGIDAAGVVAEASDGGPYAVGDAVVVTGFDLSETHDGGFAEYLRVPATWAVPLPSGLTLADSMVLGTAGVTAALGIHQLERNGLQPGQGPVAVTGASGGVGAMAVSMLAALGYQVTALTGKADQHDLLRRLGATTIQDRPDLDQIRALGSQTWAGAMDSVGGQTLAWLASTMQRGAGIAAYGNAGGAKVTTTVMPFILRGVNLLGVNSGWFPDDVRRSLWQRMATDLRPPLLAEIGHQVEFEDLPEVAREIVAGRVTGRTVVHIADPA